MNSVLGELNLDFTVVGQLLHETPLRGVSVECLGEAALPRSSRCDFASEDVVEGLSLTSDKNSAMFSFVPV